jgi:copper chaperone CopZ
MADADRYALDLGQAAVTFEIHTDHVQEFCVTHSVACDVFLVSGLLSLTVRNRESFARAFSFVQVGEESCAADDEEGAVQTAHVRINGMIFDTSMRSVQSALSIIRGVFDVRVSIADKEATIRYDPHKVLPRQFETAVRVVGCEVESVIVETPEQSPLAWKG